MKILRATQDLPEDLNGSVLAIGNFDGVHKGHQAVILAAQEEAKRLQAPAAVMAFEPHPRQFFSPGKTLFRLTDERKKLSLFAELGLDLAVILPFDASLAALSAQDFVKTILVDGLAVRHVVTGYDFYFGKDRQGTPEVMKQLAQAHGFGVTVVEAEKSDGQAYSSSHIRDCLRNGEPDKAADMLGYWWRVRANVEKGAGRGREMGFPTVNAALNDGQQLKHGIYAARIYVDADCHHGAAYLGTRPTFDEGPELAEKLEAYLFDFDGDLYGREIEIELIRFLRDDRKFDSANDLQAQMEADCDAAKAVLHEIETEDPFKDGPF